MRLARCTVYQLIQWIDDKCILPLGDTKMAASYTSSRAICSYVWHTISYTGWLSPSISLSLDKQGACSYQ